MPSLYEDFTAGLFDTQVPPCLSLYQPTHRGHPEKNQNPIRFQNLVRKLEQVLRGDCSTTDVDALLEPFRDLAEDFNFWNHTADGLAVLRSADMFRVYRLQRPVPELAIAGERFHLKPLLRIVQSADRYHLLSLSQRGTKLFVGNRDQLDPVELSSEAARAIAAVTEKTQNKPRGEARTLDSAAKGVRHGHSFVTDQTDQYKKRYFRVVDQTIIKHYSHPSGLPLLLAALPEHQTSFRQISRNPMLLENGIETNPDALSIKELREQVWAVIEPHYLARLAGLVEMFGVAQSRELGTGDLAQAMRAAVSGRVTTLLVEADRRIPGYVDATTGGIEIADATDRVADDLLDDLAAFVLRTGGQVVVVPAERMPTKTGLAATYRY